MKLEVSIGEAIDKLSILELKRHFIEDEEKRRDIDKEIAEISPQCKQYKNDYYRVLVYVNEKIWNLTNTIKTMSPSENASEFARISHEIFEFNQKRFRIKNILNRAQNSEIKEQKSYGQKNARIVTATSEIQILQKIPEIVYLTIEFDFLFFPAAAEEILKKIVSFAANSGVLCFYDDVSDAETVIDLNTFCLTETRNVFEPEPIRYRTCGLFGDFIHQLSVVNEKFLETGRKGIIYLHDCGHTFKNGIEGTFNDTYDVISKQPYVKEYRIYNNEPIDICLSTWRNNMSNNSWHDIFKKTYGVDWGTHIWLHLPDADEKWKNKIIINRPTYKFMVGFSVETAHKLQEFAKEIGVDIVFLSYNINDYNEFKNAFKLEMEYYCPTSFLDMCMAIKSCFFFIGALSAPLTIAHACRTNRMVLAYGTDDADLHERKMVNIWDNVYFDIASSMEKMRAIKFAQLLDEKNKYIEHLEQQLDFFKKNSI